MARLSATFAEHLPGPALAVVAAIVMMTAPACSRDESEPVTQPVQAGNSEEIGAKANESSSHDAQAIADFNALLDGVIDAVEAQARARKNGPKPPPVAPKKAVTTQEVKPESAPPEPKTYRELIVGQWTSSEHGMESSIEFKSDDWGKKVILW